MLKATLYLFYCSLFITYNLYRKSLNNFFENIKNEISKSLSKLLKLNKDYSLRISNYLVYLTESVILVLIFQSLFIGNFKVPTGSMEPKIKPSDKYFGDMITYNFVNPRREQIVMFHSPTTEEHFCKRLIALPGERVKIEDNKVYINDVKLNNNVKYFNYCKSDGYKLKSLMDVKEWKIPKKGDELELLLGTFRYIDNDKEVKKDIWQIRSIIKNMSDKKAIDFIRKLKKCSLEIIDSEVILNDKYTTGVILDEDVLVKLIKGEKVKLKEDYYFVLGDNSLKSSDSRYWGLVKRSRFIGRPVIRWWPLKRIEFVYYE